MATRFQMEDFSLLVSNGPRTSLPQILGTPDQTSFTGSGKVLDDFRTISGVLFHELLHILFPNSKQRASL